MSKWTSILGVIQVNTGNETFEIRGSNAQKKTEKEQLETIIGPMWTGYRPTNRKKCQLPSGKEGSIRYVITQPTRRDVYASEETYDTIITFYGNLHDFGDHEVETILLPWWYRLIEQLERRHLVRSHTLSYNDESGNSHTLARMR